jgi:thiosulfate/3-mercaptopyruvate sulfurtransferase
LLALELVGLSRGRLYPGSWSQYSHAEGREVATGS